MNEKMIYKVTFYLNWDTPRIPEMYFLSYDIENAIIVAREYITKRKWRDTTIQSIKYIGKIEN